MKWGMEPFLVLNRTISSKSVYTTLTYRFQQETYRERERERERERTIILHKLVYKMLVLFSLTVEKQRIASDISS